MDDRDNEARRQNAIAGRIASVADMYAEYGKILIRDWDDRHDERVRLAYTVLAAAVRDPLLWAALANARQAVELEQRPVVTRELRAAPPRCVHYGSCESDWLEHCAACPLARAARTTPGVRR